jgi:regulator of sigma E protease
MTYVVTFVVIFAVLVFFHELGHFGVAKLFRMRVEEFAIGFGKRLVRVGYDGQTEYTLRAFPLGGFVRIAGMEVEDAVERRLTGTAPAAAPETGVATTNAALIEQEAAEVDGADPDGFNSRPIYQRLLVILAGPVFSILLGWVAFGMIGVVYGVPDQSTVRIAEVTRGGAAEGAGLRAGDTIIALDGRPVTDAKALIDTIHASAGKPLRLTVRSETAEAATREVAVTPRLSRLEGEAKPIGLIGIKPLPIVLSTKSVGLGESFAMGTRLVGFWFEQMGRIVSSGQLKENLGGPIAIAQGTRQAVDAKGSAPLELLAQLSLSIGIFNLLPIPVLDGGHIALLTLEAIRGRKLTAEQTQRVLATGLAIIAFLFVWVMFNDITKLFVRG